MLQDNFLVGDSSLADLTTEELGNFNLLIIPNCFRIASKTADLEKRYMNQHYFYPGKGVGTVTPLQQPGEGGGSGGGRGDSEDGPGPDNIEEGPGPDNIEEGPGPDNIEEGPGPDNIGERWYNNRNRATVCNCY